MKYDKRFRERAIAFKEDGATFKQLKAVFGIDRKTHNAWVKLLRETGSVTPEQIFRSRRRKIDKDILQKAVEKKPDAYLSELASLFQCSIPAVFYALKKMGITLKKDVHLRRKIREKTGQIRERSGPNPRRKTRLYGRCGVDPCLVREHGRAPRGTKVEDVKRGRKFQRTNVIAVKIGRNMVASRCYSQNWTSHLFVEWFRKTLVQCIQKDTTVMMDSTSFHPHRKLRCLARKYNLRILFLPPYSPDLNPIEKVWANRKRALVDVLPHSPNLENAMMEYLHHGNC